ncbi:MAG TPA: hypothetical protein DDX19_09530 [Rhodopirellula baltica]|uniref:Uncharacterized protein n=1 Tax=Rhodopirellula baltica (strain DSM 10527 / NCIMB 13988 / SH1) TaxID=243090 RepID=Q7UTX9_RHOBA|nr:hypothetical protein RB3626 [Rhodopirellula baltica SH 1]HBE62965.1 hypothetical protein [Rhodopirellula baltica]
MSALLERIQIRGNDDQLNNIEITSKPCDFEASCQSETSRPAVPCRLPRRINTDRVSSSVLHSLSIVSWFCR